MKRGRKKKEYLSSEFKDAVNAMQTQELKEKIIALSKYEKEILESKENDQPLQAALSQVKDLCGAYRDALKHHKEQKKYALAVLESRGQ